LEKAKESLFVENRDQVNGLKNQVEKLESELKDSKVNSNFDDLNENL
jgi:hypothetical protein